MLTLTMTPALHTLPVESGELVWEDHGGQGQALLLLPGLGDRRQVYRHLVPLLLDEGFRVITADLRGQGDSRPAFATYDLPALRDDIGRVLEACQLEQAVLVGCSISGASAAAFALKQPEKVAGLILLNPFLRDMPAPIWFKPLMALLFQPLWGPAFWERYYRSIHVTLPPDLDAYLLRLKAMLRQPGSLQATYRLMQASKQDLWERLPQLQVPVKVLMGAQDPDFPDPAAEAQRIQQQIGAHCEIVLMTDCGHYPQSEQPQGTLDQIRKFLRQ